jgi:hypothetical protein
MEGLRVAGWQDGLCLMVTTLRPWPDVFCHPCGIVNMCSLLAQLSCLWHAAKGSLRFGRLILHSLTQRFVGNLCFHCSLVHMHAVDVICHSCIAALLVSTTWFGAQRRVCMLAKWLHKYGASRFCACILPLPPCPRACWRLWCDVFRENFCSDGVTSNHLPVTNSGPMSHLSKRQYTILGLLSFPFLVGIPY